MAFFRWKFLESTAPDPVSSQPPLHLSISAPWPPVLSQILPAPLCSSLGSTSLQLASQSANLAYAGLGPASLRPASQLAGLEIVSFWILFCWLPFHTFKLVREQGQTRIELSCHTGECEATRGRPKCRKSSSGIYWRGEDTCAYFMSKQK